MTIGKRVVYRGRVQGVGFRYTAQGLAKGYPVSGYVRNLTDGTVEVVVEGAADAVDQFLKAMATKMAGYVDSSSETEMSPQGLERFQIRF